MYWIPSIVGLSAESKLKVGLQIWYLETQQGEKQGGDNRLQVRGYGNCPRISLLS